MQEHGSSKQLVTLAVLLVCALAAPAPAQDAPAGPGISSTVDTSAMPVPDATSVLPTTSTREGVTTTMKIFVIMTLLMLAPALLVMTTSFTRILIVLALMRQAVGTQALPPGQILAGIALFLTFLVMAPTYERIHNEAIKPWLDDEPGMTQGKALKIAEGHMREFMFDQIDRVGNQEEIYLFVEYAEKRHIPSTEELRREDVSTIALVPAFILSELKTAFIMGFRIYLPFLVIDMVIATVLISMGMLMLPPVMISLPFKLLLFVMADGWHLVVTSILMGFA